MTATAVELPSAGRKEWIALAVLALPTLLVSMDLSVLNLALPHLSADLGADSVQQLWIIDTYGFVVAAFLITMGTLGDKVGRRKLLLIGAAAFALASVAAAFSTTTWELISARAAMGVAGATLAPSTLALIANMFYRNPKQMGAAIGVWVSAFMGGLALGPVAGGIMLHFFWWGSVFLLAVPVMVLLLVAGPLLLPEFTNPQAGRLDPLSVVLSLAGLLPVIYGIKELAQNGWDVLPIVAIVAGVVFAALFVKRQQSLADPLVDLRLFGNRQVSAALVINIFGAVVGGGTIFVVNVWLQAVRGLSPLHAGLLMLPSGVAMVATAMTAPAIARKVRPAYVVAAGLTVAAIGYLALTQVHANGGLVLVIVGVTITSAGSGPQAALTTNLILAASPPERSGAAASLSETCGQLGIALGAGVMGAVATAVYGAQLDSPLPAGPTADEAHQSIIGALSAAGRLPGGEAGQLVSAARTAFTDSLTAVCLISAVVLLGLAVIAARLLRDVGGGAPGGPPPEAVEAVEAAEASVEPAG
ncbi:MFS transporter [Streptomyces sp. V4-01]|uniref:MFS transporter n=1 Tax=Actinacidiphila polyblastidii TaxID=3110430 RepID=A0ABU7PC37_9ACTN|nr:MFS transporter [Streptomyces sp. V4-01]